MFETHKIKIEDGLLGSVLLNPNAGNIKTPLVYINGGPGGTYLDEHHGIKDLASDRKIIGASLISYKGY
jgi:hypothetical protein